MAADPTVIKAFAQVRSAARYCQMERRAWRQLMHCLLRLPAPD
jgi:hypothetical protein